MPDAQTERIDATNIARESYYNLCRISDLTRHADPTGHARHGAAYEVTRDACGNVLTVRVVAEARSPAQPAGG